MDSRTATLALLAEMARVDVDDLRPEAELVADLGFDSAKALELVVGLEERLKIEVPDEALAGMITVGDVLERVERIVGTP